MWTIAVLSIFLLAAPAAAQFSILTDTPCAWTTVQTACTSGGGGGGGSGTVLDVGVTTAHGVSATTANPTDHPRMTFTLGDITPSHVNGNVLTTGTWTLNGGASKTFTFSNTLTLAGTDGSTLTIGTGGTLGTLAFSSATLAANTTSTSHNFFTAYNSTTGAFTKAQPACADISDAGTACSVAAPANTTSTSHQFFTAYNSTTGAFTKAQPACADLSDSATGCSTAVTNNFGHVAVSGQTTVDANANPTTLTFAAGTNTTITTNNSTKTVTITASGSPAGATGAGQILATATTFGADNSIYANNKMTFTGTSDSVVAIDVRPKSSSTTANTLTGSSASGTPFFGFVGDNDANYNAGIWASKIYFAQAAGARASAIGGSSSGLSACLFGGTSNPDLCINYNNGLTIAAGDGIQYGSAVGASADAAPTVGLRQVAAKIYEFTDGGTNSNGWFDYNGTARIAADATNATATMASLTLSQAITLIAGRKYVGEINIKCINSTATEGIQFDFAGGTATFTSFIAGGTVFASGGTDVIGNNISTSNATAISFTTLTGESWITIKFSFVCNAAGTFIPRFAEATTAVGTATVRANSEIHMFDTP